VIIKNHQKSSNIIKNHQKSSKIIKNHEKSSKIIKHHQKSSKIIKNHQNQGSNAFFFRKIGANIYRGAWEGSGGFDEVPASPGAWKC
jgi:hypothetical protein